MQRSCFLLKCMVSIRLFCAACAVVEAVNFPVICYASGEDIPRCGACSFALGGKGTHST